MMEEQPIGFPRYKGKQVKKDNQYKKNIFKILKKSCKGSEDSYLGEDRNIYIAQVFFPDSKNHSEIISAKTIKELEIKAIQSAKELGWKI